MKKEPSSVKFLRPTLVRSGEDSSRGRLLIASCRSGSALADKVVGRYNETLKHIGEKYKVDALFDVDYAFPDSETCVRLKTNVNGSDVYLFQSLFDPTSERSIDQNYIAFLLAVRAFKEHGARSVTGILPYLTYARQDKPTPFRREPVSSRLFAELSITSGLDRLITWHTHSDQIRGFYGSLPMNMLDPLVYFIDEFKQFKEDSKTIAIAADEGVSGLITRFGRTLSISSAIAAKKREGPDTVTISEIIGDFKGKARLIVLDDMISGAGTMVTLIEKLFSELGGQIEELHIAVSHNLCLPKAYERMAALKKKYGAVFKRLIVTNSIPQTLHFRKLEFVEVACLSERLCHVINRIHFEGSVSEIFIREQ
jgi:ribose-phosphate pyrophosphokinase